MHELEHGGKLWAKKGLNGHWIEKTRSGDAKLGAQNVEDVLAGVSIVLAVRASA